MNPFKNIPSEKIIWYIFFAFIFISAIYGAFQKYFIKKKCPKCKNLWTRQLFKENMGKNYGDIYHQDYRVFLKCNKCGHSWHIIHTRYFGD
jgi:hypothetical protein